MGWETERTTQARTRYGCFLPDLTGLARGLSAADLPPHYIRAPQRRGKFWVMAAMRSATAADRSVKQCGMDLVLLLIQGKTGRPTPFQHPRRRLHRGEDRSGTIHVPALYHI